MPTYATKEELAAYAAGTAYSSRLPAENARDRLLELAELDLDAEAFPILPLHDDPAKRKVQPTGDLEARERAALSRATCAQAIYRIEMGDEHFVRAQRQRVSGRAFTAEGKLPIVGPQAERELAAGGLFRLTTRVGGRGVTSEADSFQST